MKIVTWGVLDVLGLEKLGQLLNDPFLGQSFDDDPADEGQRDRPVLGDADRLAQLRDLEDADLEKVAGADAVGPDELVPRRLRLGRRLGLRQGLAVPMPLQASATVKAKTKTLTIFFISKLPNLRFPSSRLFSLNQKQGPVIFWVSFPAPISPQSCREFPK